MKYCINCEQMVQPAKSGFNVIAFVILLCLGCCPGIIYILYHVLKAEKCPMCNSQNWGVKPQQQFKPDTSIRFCPDCGVEIKTGNDFCIQCGKKIN